MRGAAWTSHAEAAAEAGRPQSWDHKIRVGACAISQLAEWTRECLLNNPVHVTNGKRIDSGSRPTTTIWVDASLWGWGAVIIGPDGTATDHLDGPCEHGYSCSAHT